MKKLGSLCKKFILVVIIIYAVITFINQQQILNSYAANSEDLDEQITEATEYQEELNEEKENVDSEEYIEEMAREKLNMYKSNERVYISSEWKSGFIVNKLDFFCLPARIVVRKIDNKELERV